MLTAMRRRRSWAILASIGAHLGVLTAVLLQHPTLHIPVEPGGPPVAIIPLLILPRTPPPVGARGVKPAPIQLHQRQLRAPSEPTPVAPVVIAPPKPAETPVQAPEPVTAKEAPQPSAAPVPDAMRAALRTTLGCNSDTLSRDERARCQERFGRGARDAPYLAQPLSKDKRTALEEAGAAKLAARATMDRPLGAPGPIEPSDYDGNPYMTGAGQDILGPVNLPPSKRAARKLQPLPP
jgi:hypothetical protein